MMETSGAESHSASHNVLTTSPSGGQFKLLPSLNGIAAGRCLFDLFLAIAPSENIRSLYFFRLTALPPEDSRSTSSIGTISCECL